MSQWIKADGDVLDVSPKEGKYSLEELQKMVGGYIEVIRLPGEQLMIVNEDGRAFELPINLTASAACGMNIVGDVVLIDVEEMG